MDYFDDVFHTFLGLDSVNCLAVNGTVTSLPVLIQNILNCVSKTNEAFTGLERHGGKWLMTKFSFWGGVKVKVKWYTTKYGDPYSEFVLCIYPIQSAHTHTMNTHPEQWAAIYAAAPGEQLGVWCLAQGHLSRDVEGGESAVHSLPPPTIPAGPRLELATFRLRVRLSNH